MELHPATQLARELVRLPSQPGSGGQVRVAEQLADRFDSSGFNVQFQEYAPGHANIVAVRGDPTRPALGFTGHLDTVAVDGSQWSVDPHGGLIRDGRLWGRGSADMKAGVAAMVHVLCAEIEAQPRRSDDPTIVVVLTAQEELGCLGAKSIVEDPEIHLPAVSHLVVCEPTSNRPELGHRGAVWLDIEASGRSCHGSTPELGVNAFTRLITALSSVEEWLDRHPSSHPALGHRTSNVGVVRAGSMRNIVPDRAAAELDIRVAETGDLHDLSEALQRQVGEQAVIREILALEPVWTDASEPWFADMIRAADELTGRRDAVRAARFFTDASVLTPAFGSPPTVILGPGSADLAHVINEWCSVDEIATATELYHGIVNRHRRTLQSN